MPSETDVPRRRGCGPQALTTGWDDHRAWRDPAALRHPDDPYGAGRGTRKRPGWSD
ncbi:hypothetical protein [Streptomyces sp. FIT100]|uniref:hypothetical protein n=1 Tax=Streptomyces sp. FIT100 TaxID=2837956 RepID=UPI0021CAA02A|nr:hypothetical protein [Streptomyces sp. FIT100]UUN28543.1 hypothetical protein KK483_20795 [Streptomyces sp. FIT100]